MKKLEHGDAETSSTDNAAIPDLHEREHNEETQGAQSVERRYVQGERTRIARPSGARDHIDGRVRRTIGRSEATPCFQAALSWAVRELTCRTRFDVVSHPAEVNLVSTCWRRIPHSARSAGIAKQDQQVLARAAPSPLADNKPLLPCSRTSGAPPLSSATTGFFMAIASRNTIQRLLKRRESKHVGCREQRGMSVRAVKITLSVRPSSQQGLSSAVKLVALLVDRHAR